MKTKDTHRFIVREGNKHHRFAVENISHIVCEGYLCTLYRTKGGNETFAKSLSYFEVLLAELPFFRISRNAIVNLEEIAWVECKGRKRNAIMKCDERLPIADRRWAGFKNKFYSETLTAKNDTLAEENDTPEKHVDIRCF
ncbi:MAG: LytTR family transcriptional regulator [Bacteroidales bacterium]|nr:LytTR family transcriptional regulator [Bacteroidales bacterium]